MLAVMFPVSILGASSHALNLVVTPELTVPTELLKTKPLDRLTLTLTLTRSRGSTTRSSCPIKFLAGFVGATQDPETKTVSPRVGWYIVREGAGEAGSGPRAMKKSAEEDKKGAKRHRHLRPLF